VQTVGADRICARDLARARGVFPEDGFHYRISERRCGKRLELEPSTAPDGTVCFRPQPAAAGDRPDDDPDRRVVFAIDNGTGAGPLVIDAYDLGSRGLRLVRLTRPRP